MTLRYSTNQAAASAGKRARRRDTIPNTPDIVLAVAKIRKNGAASPPQFSQSYRDSEIYVEAIPVNGYVLFDGRARILSSFTTRATWFRVQADDGKQYVIIETLVGWVEPPAPQPEKVAIPMTRYVVSLSSGVPSAVTAGLSIRRYGRENVDLVFADTEPLLLAPPQIAGYLPANTATSDFDDFRQMLRMQRLAQYDKGEAWIGCDLPYRFRWQSAKGVSQADVERNLFYYGQAGGL